MALLNAGVPLVAVAAVLGASCYGPRYDECRVFCQLGACPAGQSCGADGYCYPEALDPSAHDCALRPDAALDGGGGGTDGNGASDGGGTGPDAAPCPDCPFIPSNLDSGQDFFVTTYDLVLGGADEVVLDTDALSLEAMDGPIVLPEEVFRVHTSADGELAVLRVRNFTVDYGGLQVRGQRPLVLVATEQLQVLGPITHAGVDAQCQGSDGGPTALHGGGGAGGSYGAIGGAGAGLGGTPGDVSGDPTNIPLRAGCAGGSGGDGGEGKGGEGGRAGGAIQLVAGETIVLASVVCGSGGGGDGGEAGETDANGHGGGGGGGSGGAILLESVGLQVEEGGALVAHGGGGGGGGGLAFGGGSQAGNRTCSPSAAPTGGLGAHDCAGEFNRGGNGAYAAIAAENGSSAGQCSSAGGGGGGGVGRIRVNRSSGSTSVPASPAASLGQVQAP